jgi:hypothetical protein
MVQPINRIYLYLTPFIFVYDRKVQTIVGIGQTFDKIFAYNG